MEIPTPRIYPKKNVTSGDLSAVNMTALAPAQRAALAAKTIIKAQTMVANITNPPPTPTVVLSNSPAAAASPTPAVNTLPEAGKTAVSVHHTDPASPPLTPSCMSIHSLPCTPAVMQQHNSEGVGLQL